MGIKKRLSILLCTTLMFSLVLGTITPAFAKSSREAVIETIVGEVNVTKAGGSKSYRAFEGMKLNQGDHIETGVGSKVVLRIVDHDDEVTIDERSSMYISELSENTKGKKSKVKMWAGSLWGKVKTLTGSDDEFTVETPTAVMGVRGTTLLVGVDPATGESNFFIASGLGKVSKKDATDSESGTTLYPNQQISLDKDTKSEDYDDYTNVADLEGLIANTSNAIIEAILASKAAIDQENQEYIEKLQAGEGGVDQEAIDRINQNLDNLVGNIIKSAIVQNKVSKADIQVLIDKINAQLDKKLDLEAVKAPVLSDAEKAKQAQVKQLEEERKKKQAAEKLKQDALKQQNEELQKKLKDQLEKQKQEKEKAAQAAKDKATEEFAKKLDAAAKAAFEAKQKEIEAEKKKQDAAVLDAKGKEAAPTPGVVVPSPSNNNNNNNEPTKNPQVIMADITQGDENSPAELNIYLNDFEDLNVYAAQLHFTHEEYIYAHDWDEDEVLPSAIFTETDSEFVHLLGRSNYTEDSETESETYMAETMFVITKYDSEHVARINGRKLLITIKLSAQQDGYIKLEKVILVDKTGKKLNFNFNVQSEEIHAAYNIG